MAESAISSVSSTFTSTGALGIDLHTQGLQQMVISSALSTLTKSDVHIQTN